MNLRTLRWIVTKEFKTLSCNYKMSIQSSVRELDSIKAEIKRTTDHVKGLRARAKVIEGDITDYLQSTKQEGVKYNNQSFVLEQSSSHVRKGKKDKEEETMRLLRNMGVSDTGNSYSRLMAVQKGEEVETTKLRVKKDKVKTDY
jgi:hypothetical protein